MFIKKLVTVTLACMTIAAGTVFGQNPRYPFPQEIEYPNGYIPTTSGLNSQKVQNWYNSWKEEHLMPCGDGRIGINSHDTPKGQSGWAEQVKVETIGWGLIAAAYMGDKATFDGIYKYYNSKLDDPKSDGMMAWKTTCNSIIDGGSATDGDLDVAFGLIVASWQWPNATPSYENEAKKVLGKTEKLIRDCEGLSVLAGGSRDSYAHNQYVEYDGVYGGECNSPNNNYTDLSYYFPAFFRVFAEVTGKSMWSKLANDTYTHLDRNYHRTTGLVSGWQNIKTGVPSAGASGNPDGDAYYNYDASRVPWRIALDYLWNGTTAAKSWLTLITNWSANGFNGTTTTHKDGYFIDGSVKDAHSRNDAGFAFTGAWAAGAMANENQTVRNTHWTYAASRDEDYWYHRSLGVVYLLTLTGNMWTPDIIAGGVSGFRIAETITGEGTITRNPAKIRYSTGDKVTLTADPAFGWNFVGWTGAATGNNPTVQVTIGNADLNITAEFKQDPAHAANLVKDGGFTKSIGNPWVLNRWANNQDNPNMASATLNGNGSVTVNINSTPPSDSIYDLQLVQDSISLVMGQTYVISFEASAASERTIQVMSQKAATPWTNYFSQTISLKTGEMQPFIYEFTMEQASDQQARIGFNMGNSTADVTIGNVFVIPKSAMSINMKRKTAFFAHKPLVSVRGRTLYVSSPSVSKLSVRVIDVKGITRARFNAKEGRSNFLLTKIPAGRYFVEIKGMGIRQTLPVVVVK